MTQNNKRRETIGFLWYLLAMASLLAFFASVDIVAI